MKRYLFDFDGTLVDSMPTYVSSMLRILDENNISYEDDIVKTITPLGLMGTAKYFIELGLDKELNDIVALMGKYMLEAYHYHIPAKENVINTLRKLKENEADLNVLTASPHITLDACLKRLGIYDLFTNVWSCDDFETTKADPEIYRMAAEKMGCDVSEVWFFDDNLNADLTAKSAGMKVCGVYDDSSKEYAQEMKEVCDNYIYNFSELLKPYMSTEIRSERMLILPVSKRYLDDIAEYACDLENAPYMVYLPYPSKDAYEKYLEESIVQWKSGDADFYEFVVIYEGKAIGGITIYMSPDRTSGELGWIVNKKYWRKGFAYEAARAVMEYGKTKLNLKTFTAECDDRNFASYSLMEKLGFTLESRDSYRHYARTGESALERKYIYHVEGEG